MNPRQVGNGGLYVGSVMQGDGTISNPLTIVDVARAAVAANVVAECAAGAPNGQILYTGSDPGSMAELSLANVAAYFEGAEDLNRQPYHPVYVDTFTSDVTIHSVVNDGETGLGNVIVLCAPNWGTYDVVCPAYSSLGTARKFGENVRIRRGYMVAFVINQAGYWVPLQ